MKENNNQSIVNSSTDKEKVIIVFESGMLKKEDVGTLSMRPHVMILGSIDLICGKRYLHITPDRPIYYLQSVNEGQVNHNHDVTTNYFKRFYNSDLIEEVMKCQSLSGWQLVKN